MAQHVVLFEDHSLMNFRPLAASTPVYELRFGMFNTRERVELAAERGTLLCRSLLAPLHTCPGWNINPDCLPADIDEDQMILWIGARFGGKLDDLKSLYGCDSPWLHLDEHGLVAACLNPADSRRCLESWHQWQSGPAVQGMPTEKWQLPALGLDNQEAPASVSSLGFVWDIVPATANFLADDVEFLATGQSFSRHPFGLIPASDNPNPFWLEPGRLTQEKPGLWLGQDVELAADLAIDTTEGPVIIDQGVKILPHCYLEGPLYVGPGSRIKAGATIYGESSFGIGNRLAGEIGESTFQDFANKQHEGFIGHAVIGSWTNLGAMTTCSDLKNNYGPVRVDLGSGSQDTGLRFVGLMLGDHVKTAIGTLFNTGTVVGFASNIFGGLMPPKFVPNFSWGGQAGSPAYDVDRAWETAAVVMSRRGCQLTDPAIKLMRTLV